MTGDTWRPMAEPTLTWKQYEMGRSALIDLLLLAYIAMLISIIYRSIYCCMLTVIHRSMERVNE